MSIERLLGLLGKMIDSTDETVSGLAERIDISAPTLYAIRRGAVVDIRTSTMLQIVDGLGYEIQIRRKAE